MDVRNPFLRPAPRSVVVGSAVFLVALGWAGHVASDRYFDYGDASRELPRAVERYRAAGLPWTADEIAPRAMIPPEDDATPLLHKAIAALAQPVGRRMGSKRVRRQGRATGRRSSGSLRRRRPV